MMLAADNALHTALVFYGSLFLLGLWTWPLAARLFPRQPCAAYLLARWLGFFGFGLLAFLLAGTGKMALGGRVSWYCLIGWLCLLCCFWRAGGSGVLAALRDKRRLLFMLEGLSLLLFFSLPAPWCTKRPKRRRHLLL